MTNEEEKRLRDENWKLKALIKATLEAWDNGFSYPSIRNIELMREAVK